MAQERRVLLANGQYITIVQTTGTSSGDVMSQSAVTAALSTKSDVGHTHNVSAITGGTFGTNMIADGAVTLAKLGSDVPISTTSYETVKVSGLTTGGTAAVGAEVTIGGDVYRFDNTGVVYAQIPYGQVYKIVGVTSNTWMSSYNTTYTANTSLRTVSLTYAIPNGVFIEATDGTLYSPFAWASNKTPNSIVVSSDSVRLRIALTEPSSIMAISSAYTDPLDNYMTAISDATAAKADYNGSGNTANIIKMQPSTAYAAGYCNSFTFPDGKTKGFLPSLGQLNLAYQNKATVNAALTACGGTAMDEGTYNNYWSSTFWGFYSESGARDCWTFHWSDGNVAYSSNLIIGNYVRPFADY